MDLTELSPTSKKPLSVNDPTKGQTILCRMFDLHLAAPCFVTPDKSALLKYVENNSLVPSLK